MNREYRFTISNLAELDDRLLNQTVQLFVEGFFKQAADLMKVDLETCADAFKHSFRKEHYYVALQDGNVLGLLAVSSRKGRSHAFNKSILQQEFGFWKGSLVHYFLKKELEKTIHLNHEQCYIESVTTSEEARGQGVATALIQYLFEHLEYKEFLLEVVDTNVSAFRLYERLGFTVFKRKKAGFFDKKGGFNERWYMRRVRG